MKAYEIVTTEILSALDKGVIPWRKPWVTGTPKSITTNKEYRGINILILSLRPYCSRYWVTYKEAQKRNGQVKKGEKGTPVVYWHWRTQEELQKLISTGKAKEPAPCVPFVSTVFNLEQVEGLERPADDVPPEIEKREERAERLIQEMPFPPEISHGASFVPCYRPILDKVEMPFRSQFESLDEYYSTLFHELTHSVDHESRLGKFTDYSVERPREKYSFDELVAEFGASFLCGISGIASALVQENSASYIAGWSTLFKRDKAIILKSASRAQRSVDFIVNNTFERKTKVEEEISIGA